MAIQNFATIAFTNIRHRKTRSFLTVIAIVIGIAAVVSLISVSQGMQTAIAKQFESLGTDKILIMPGGGGSMLTSLAFGAGELTDHDIDLIENVRGVEYASGVIFKNARVTFNDETKYTFIIGMPTGPEGKFVLENYQVEGRYLEQGDKYKAVIGYLLPKGEFFKKDVNLGARLTIEGQEFKVVGSLQEIGNKADDTQIYIPLDTAREVFNEPTQINFIYAKVQKGYNPSEVADDIKNAMRKDRDQKRGEEDFTVQTTEQLMQTMNSIMGIVQLILVGIAGISLLVGGIGIMNTMYTSVLERTREIGVMKAIGARNSNILTIFLLEAGIIGLLGGIFGTLLGIGLAKIVEIAGGQMGFMSLKMGVTPQLIAMGLGFAFIVGCLSGLLPARRAAKLQPADALRYE